MAGKRILILVCTVGGSPQPILSAIRDLRPDRVCFLCTPNDPNGRAAGSVGQVIGEGGDTIPLRAGLAADRFEVCEIPHDDPDAAFAIIRERLTDLVRRHPGARIVADYTGGTKSMGAALVLAALEHGSGATTLQFMAGERADLDKVRDGSERPQRIPTDLITANRAVAVHVAAWRAYGYGEAETGLAELHDDIAGVDLAPRAMVERIATLRDLSRAFAAWDRFDHAEALARLQPLAAALPGFAAPYLQPLTRLAQPETREPLVLLDLWRNAERRAERHQFDDAVARCYRLMEWTAQWLLGQHCGINTGNVKKEQLRPLLAQKLTRGRNGRWKAGLALAWEIVIDKVPDSPSARFFNPAARSRDTPWKHLNDWIEDRHQSILAHGATPIDAGGWDRIGGWVRDRFLPVLGDEMRRCGIRPDLPQLPQQPPALG